MRAIIIDDKDAKALLERLELTKFTHRGSGRSLAEKHGVAGTTADAMTEDIHRWFHCVVCSWLQEQGASTVR